MMIAADLMTTDVFTVRPEMPVAEVARLILERRVTSIPVVDEAGRLLGIVSEGDLVRSAQTKDQAHRSWWLTLLTSGGSKEADLLGQGDRLVEEVMSKDVLLASEDESLKRLIELLSRQRIKRLPIVKGGKLVGIVSRVDVLRHLAAARTLNVEPWQEAG